MKQYTDWNSPYHLFHKCKVTDVSSVAEFLDRYYKQDQYTGRGDEYAAVLLTTHKERFEKYDVDWISKHDSCTGEVVAFYGDEVV